VSAQVVYGIKIWRGSENEIDRSILEWKLTGISRPDTGAADRSLLDERKPCHGGSKPTSPGIEGKHHSFVGPLVRSRAGKIQGEGRASGLGYDQAGEYDPGETPLCLVRLLIDRAGEGTKLFLRLGRKPIVYELAVFWQHALPDLRKMGPSKPDLNLCTTENPRAKPL
jgi:hypothetical protein